MGAGWRVAHDPDPSDGIQYDTFHDGPPKPDGSMVAYCAPPPPTDPQED